MTSNSPKRYAVSQLWLPIPVLVLFVLVPTFVELTLIAADNALLADTRLRPRTYQYGAFWAGLLDNWRPNYPAQPYLMFLTYSFLHAGFWHLLGNMIGLIVLMQLNTPWVTTRRFFLIYVTSAVGGALAFGVLGSVLNPMVGASGALFGLVGSWKWNDWRAVAPTRRRIGMIARDTFLLILLNLIMWYANDGALAWEAHLGGFVTGLCVMAILNRRDHVR